MSPLPTEVFRALSDPDVIQGDRHAVAAFLQGYLLTGEIPDAPKIRTGPQIRLQGTREPIGQCSWRWSEMRGKYVGSPFWSIEALRAFEVVQSENPDCSLKAVARIASHRDRGESQLQHEHVFPRKAWIELMSPRLGNWQAGQVDELEALMDRYCVGCIVTYREHQELGDEGILDNPWLRYRGSSIRLVHNSEWPEPHAEWIADAGLIGDDKLPKSA